MGSFGELTLDISEIIIFYLTESQCTARIFLCNRNA